MCVINVKYKFRDNNKSKKLNFRKGSSCKQKISRTNFTIL